MRAMKHKVLGEHEEGEWLVRDLYEELKLWGYPKGGEIRTYYQKRRGTYYCGDTRCPSETLRRKGDTRTVGGRGYSV